MDWIFIATSKKPIGFQVQFNAEFPRQVMNFPWITKLNENKKKPKHL